MGRIRVVFREYLSAVLFIFALWFLLLLLTLVPLLGLAAAIVGSFYINCLAGLIFGNIHGRTGRHFD